MISYPRSLIAGCLACLLPFSAFAEAPVVDDSQNFALLDQQTASERPVNKAQMNSYSNDEETPLASDNVSASANSNVTLLNKIQGLQQEIQELRGQLEVQAHDLKLLQQQQLAFYKDLDARLRNEPSKTAKTTPAADMTIGQPELPSTAAATPVISPPPANNTSHINPADEQISYLAAYELVKNKKYDDALVAMQNFVNKYPQGGYTSNAQYWLGELYLLKKDYPAAIQHFETVLQQFPSSNKLAASQLKLGYALAAAGRKEEAIARLQKVISDYPNTNTAQLAKAKLESLSR